MTTFFLILAFVAVFALGMAAAFLAMGFILKHDSDTNEGVWLTYNKKDDEWKVFGNIPETVAKASSHWRQIRKVC